MARGFNALPTWALVLIVIGVGVGLYLQRKAEERRVDDAVVVNANEVAPRPEPTKNPPARPERATARPPELNVALGTPAAPGHSDYIISRSQYVAGYDREKGIPDWVAWHLDATDLGNAQRSQFAPDPTLPRGYYRVTPNDYRNSGYDRGHMCPSADRSTSPEENRATFVMTNIVPQAPDNNQGPWADFENYCRDLARSGSELYVVAGVAGPFVPLANGKVSAPAATWKAVLILPLGDDDLARVNGSTHVVAISIPNASGVRERPWRDFLTSVDQIEATTGFDLFAALPDDVENAIESRVDR